MDVGTAQRGHGTGHALHEIQRPGHRPARYEAPTSLAAALDLLDRHGDRARPVAGGTDLLVELDRGLRPGVDVLVDLGRIPDLDRITGDADTLLLGPLVTHNQVVADPVCGTSATPLAQACWEVGSPPLRNRATVVGNLVTASPANDTISALLALGASIELTSSAGTRTLALEEFFTGFRTVARRPEELVTTVTVPRLRARQRGVFVKLGLRRAQAISVVHLAVVVGFDAPAPGEGPVDGVVTEVRLAVGSVAPIVILVPAVADALVGRSLSGPDGRAAIDAAARSVVSAISPVDDLRAPADYRLDLAATMTGRALTTLAQGHHRRAWPDAPPRLWLAGFDGRVSAPIAGGPVSLGPDDPVTATVNGRPVTGADAPGEVLLDWLRTHAGTTGVKEGCAEGECGACAVHLDGAAVLSCLVPAGRAAGADITTVEGLSAGPSLHLVQEAFVAAGAVQCGFCTPGLVMVAAALLAERPCPSREQVRAGLAGNLCRCTGYGAIHQALASAAAGTPGGGTPAGDGGTPGTGAPAESGAAGTGLGADGVGR